MQPPCSLVAPRAPHHPPSRLFIYILRSMCAGQNALLRLTVAKVKQELRDSEGEKRDEGTKKGVPCGTP